MPAVSVPVRCRAAGRWSTRLTRGEKTGNVPGSGLDHGDPKDNPARYSDMLATALPDRTKLSDVHVLMYAVRAKLAPWPEGDVAKQESSSSGQDVAALICAIARDKDRAAFVTLFRHYAPRIKAWLIRRGAAAEAAEELAQEALLTIWRKAGAFDPNGASAPAWVFTIARNLWIDRVRHEGRAKLHDVYELLEGDAPERPDEALNATEREQRVRDALSQLPADQIRVVELSFIEGRANSQDSAGDGEIAPASGHGPAAWTSR